MSSIATNAKVSDLVLEEPVRARIFERFGIDYCCGGRIPLAEACAKRGLDLTAVVQALDESAEPGPEDIDWRLVPVADLVDHIVGVHHTYLRLELPSLRQLVDKVATRHGDRHPELVEVQRVYEAISDELEQHMVKEERILFPACVALGRNEATTFPFGTVENPIAAMLHEHDVVAAGLERLSDLTGGYEPPVDACTSYRAMLGRLETFDTDTRRHVHEENNALFPRVIALESGLT